MTATLSVADRADAIRWETSQFSTAPSPSVADRGSRVMREVSARAAYQLLLHRRAVLVDARSSSVRRAEGDVHDSMRPMRLEPEAVTLLAALRGGKPVLLLADEQTTPPAPLDATVRRVAGGVRAWREAGLPLAS